ncbi:MAG: DNA-processing protein DprA [Ignavibacteria bacterium]|nr:DNA-processing protein DprA [Ignavibacteria bacterium]
MLELIYFLTKIENIGNIRILNILKKFNTLKELKSADKRILTKIEGISESTANSIISMLNKSDDFKKSYDLLYDTLEKKNIKTVTIFDDEYPANLKNIYDPPVLLYYKGKLNKTDEFSISVIGTRYPTEYGRNVCLNLVKELSELKIPIISGMAKGIDSVSHLAALSNDNLTYAILGSGVDVVYPAENRKLYQEICERGVVISEYEPGAKPDKVNFPRRNRIISGISLGTIIIETGIRGGSMITAELAIDQNKEIFAVPGPVFSKRSEGANFLIKQGMAKLITGSEDVINELEYKLNSYIKKDVKKTAVKDIELNLFERKLFEEIKDEPVHIDSLSENTELNISDCLVNLLSLEFKGLIRQLPGKKFIRLK